MSALAERRRGISPYEENRDYVLAVLGRRCGWLATDDREAVFHDAYAVMLEKERGGQLEVAAMHPRQVRAYLTQTAINKALDIGKSAAHNRVEPLDELVIERSDDATPPEEAVFANMDGARLREIVAELPERRQAIVKLRYFLDRAPDEIQRLLGISERAYRRDLERALRHIAERSELGRDGRFCDSRRSLIIAYVSGLAGPNRAREAREHLASCPACTSWAVTLRSAVGKAAAMAPLPAIVPAGRIDRVAETAAGLRDSLADLVGGAREHVLMISTRADPSSAGYLGAARPGTVAAAIAGCIAVGSGATYCAVEGVPDPVRQLVVPQVEPAPERRERKPPEQTSEVVPPPPEVVATTPEPAPQLPVPEPQANSEPAPPQPEPVPVPPPVEQEFGLEGAGPAAPAEPAPQASAPAATPPASSGSDPAGAEFGP